MSKSRGAIGVHTIVVDGDVLGQILFGGSNGTAFKRAASIRTELDGVPGVNDMPGRVIIATSPDGTAAVVDALTIDSTQKSTFGGAVSVDTGFDFQVNSVSVLNATTLGAAVVAS